MNDLILHELREILIEWKWWGYHKKVVGKHDYSNWFLSLTQKNYKTDSCLWLTSDKIMGAENDLFILQCKSSVGPCYNGRVNMSFGCRTYSEDTNIALVQFFRKTNSGSHPNHEKQRQIAMTESESLQWCDSRFRQTTLNTWIHCSDQAHED